MLAMISRIARRKITYAWLFVPVFILALVQFMLFPAFDAGEVLVDVIAREHPNLCSGSLGGDVKRSGLHAGLPKQRGGSGREGAGKAEDQAEQSRISNCLVRSQIEVASRANELAFYGGISSTAGTFIAGMAAIISLLAIAISRLTETGSGDVTAVVSFTAVSASSDDGALVVHNRGTVPFFLDALTINSVHVEHSACANGLREVPAAESVTFTVQLTNRLGKSKCFVRVRSVEGKPVELAIVLKRLGSGWQLADVKKLSLIRL